MLVQTLVLVLVKLGVFEIYFYLFGEKEKYIRRSSSSRALLDAGKTQQNTILLKARKDFSSLSKFKRCLIRADLSKYLLYCID